MPKDFYQIDPGDNSAPSKPTEVLLGYDAKFRIAFRAYVNLTVRSTLANVTTSSATTMWAFTRHL